MLSGAVSLWMRHGDGGAVEQATVAFVLVVAGWLFEKKLGLVRMFRAHAVRPYEFFNTAAVP